MEYKWMFKPNPKLLQACSHDTALYMYLCTLIHNGPFVNHRLFIEHRAVVCQWLLDYFNYFCPVLHILCSVSNLQTFSFIYLHISGNVMHEMGCFHTINVSVHVCMCTQRIKILTYCSMCGKIISRQICIVKTLVYLQCELFSYKEKY